MKSFEIPYYNDYISPSLAEHLLKKAKPHPSIRGLVEVGSGGGLETKEALAFLVNLYTELKLDLAKVLKQRQLDRLFIDERVKAYSEYNKKLGREISDSDYETILGLEDASGRVVIGPLSENYTKPAGNPVAPIPEYLQGPHVTLFGPPDTAKMAINAMNAFHRRIPDEPAIVEQLLKEDTSNPKWGADDEDSKTPLREDLVDAAVNLTACFNGTLSFEDKKKYELAKDHLALPIKRFPGLALPSTFLFYNENPIPLHLYDFALHFYENWHNPKSLCFYVPKLENEEEAKYIHKMISCAETAIKKIHPEYELGSVRLMIVLENPRAILRTHEIMDALHPYFVGASLGWHDYLGSTARLFKEDSHYRIPVKADPDIVIKYIKASHLLLADVVGARGGIKVGGMYGILPLDNDTKGDSFQMTMVGFIKDVITQMKRDLTGFWVAHPDFVRLGMALVQAWKLHAKGDSKPLETLIKDLLIEKYHKVVIDFVFGSDIKGLDIDDPNYVRSLLVADIKESDFISNSHPDEIRYNVFQSLQYITDWLSGNGCVALPAIVKGVPVRVMDDLATAERSRWEVWHELYHGRFSKIDFIRIVHEEMNFIRRNLSNDKKIVAIHYEGEAAKWYPLATQIMLKLMTDKNPVEFATELLMPFTVEELRTAKDPLAEIQKIDPDKLKLEDDIERLHHYFEACGCDRFASEMAKDQILDINKAKELIMSFSKEEVLQAASFHGDIGQDKKSLDAQAASEQAKVLDADNSVKNELRQLGQEYLDKFGFKFLVSAKGKSADELLSILKSRINNSADSELQAAREALWEITYKRLSLSIKADELKSFENLKKKHEIKNYSMALINKDHIQVLGDTSCYEFASLSKSMASAKALELFKEKAISLESPVNELLKQYGSSFQLEGPWGDDVLVKHLMNHTALNMHYVNGFKPSEGLPKTLELIQGQHGYDKVAVLNEPGTKFHYSGAGFLLLQHLVELILGQEIAETKYSQLKSENYMMFPNFAAGMVGTAKDYAKFLQKLTKAYHDVDGCEEISHDTAVEMLYGEDFGSTEFIGAKAGLGVFIAEASDNKIALHQGANEGYRALYLHCFSGPDEGKGFVIFAEGDNEAVPFIGQCAQELIEKLNFTGINTEKFKKQFDDSKISQEQIVNLGYKELVFDAFEPCLPPQIIHTSAKRDLNEYDLCQNAEIKNVSNQRFARAENLISSHRPQFDPAEFCAQGKVMDSWESARHNEKEFHSLELCFKAAEEINYVEFSTEYHLGNQVEFVSLEAYDETKNSWLEILPKTKLEGHSQLRLKLAKTVKTKVVHVKAYPDGGLSRIGLYKSVPDEKLFDGKSHLCKSEIPKTLKPLSIPWKTEQAKAKVLAASNEHYAPASQLLSPFRQLHMFDGFESARSRVKDHFETLDIELIEPTDVKGLIFDFSYFINNNPKTISVLGQGPSDSEWQVLAAQIRVKAFAGNMKKLVFENPKKLKKLRLLVYPDGGINRLGII